MVEQQHIQVVIPIVVEKIGLVAESRAGQSKSSGLVFKMRNTIGIVA